MRLDAQRGAIERRTPRLVRCDINPGMGDMTQAWQRPRRATFTEEPR